MNAAAGVPLFPFFSFSFSFSALYFLYVSMRDFGGGVRGLHGIPSFFAQASRSAMIFLRSGSLHQSPTGRVPL